MSDFKYEINDGKATITGYTGSGGAVPRVIDGAKVTVIGVKESPEDLIFQALGKTLKFYGKGESNG